MQGSDTFMHMSGCGLLLVRFGADCFDLVRFGSGAIKVPGFEFRVSRGFSLQCAHGCSRAFHLFHRSLLCIMVTCWPESVTLREKSFLHSFSSARCRKKLHLSTMYKGHKRA